MELLLDTLSVNEGRVAENAVAQALRANGVELFFYSRPDRGDGNGRMEQHPSPPALHGHVPVMPPSRTAPPRSDIPPLTPNTP